MILARPLRIVSLIASSTELICELGLEQSLVGISHECDYPASIRHLPVCTGPKFIPDGTSYQIDQKVKAILQESLSVYRVDAVLLESLRPTHIITQSQCEVCAVSLRDVEDAACRLISSQPDIVSLEPNCLEDVWADIRKVGASLAISDVAENLIGRLKQRLAAISAITSAVAIEDRPKIVFIEWIDPLMTGGNWMPELIAIAGGCNLFGETGKHSPPISWSDVVRSDPEVIIVSPCGFDIPRTLAEMHVLSAHPSWEKLSAVRNNRVFVADGNQFFNRPGPRLVESCEILAELIHPHLFHFNHEETGGWIRFTAIPSNAPSDTRA